jgi:hypothetical protein
MMMAVVLVLVVVTMVMMKIITTVVRYEHRQWKVDVKFSDVDDQTHAQVVGPEPCLLTNDPTVPYNCTSVENMPVPPPLRSDVLKSAIETSYKHLSRPFYKVIAALSRAIIESILQCDRGHLQALLLGY